MYLHIYIYIYIIHTCNEIPVEIDIPQCTMFAGIATSNNREEVNSD